MPHHHLSRRQVLRAGAAAVAAGALRPRSAFAAAQPSLFELALEDPRGAVAAGWRTSGVLRAPRRFDTVGLRWASGAVAAEVRARRTGGSWGPWLPLHAIGDHAPDGARAILGTEPAYTGAADLLQLRTRGHARGLRARFVHAGPATRAARASAARAPRRPASGARNAQSVPPRVITRTEWGGDAHPPRVPPEYGVVQAAFVHHTVSRNDYGPEESAAIVLGICRFHRDSNGWNDVGYNFLVDRYGQVFEGRAGGVDQAVIGAQAQGYNAQSTGVALIGTHTGVPATEAALEALGRLIGWKLSLHGVPVAGTTVLTSAGGSANRYPAGTPVTLERVSGHRDGDKTTCPGDTVYAALPDIRARAGRYAAPLGGLTMRADGTTLRFPRPLSLTGWLRHHDGSTRPGARVAIEFQAAGGPWTVLGAAETDGTGTWRAAVQLPDSGVVRVVHAEEAIVSPLLSVRVIPRLTLRPQPVTVRAGGQVTLAGAYAPNVTPRTGTVVVERREGRGYRRVTSRTVTIQGGAYAVRMRLRRPGAYRVSVLVGDAVVRRTVRAVAAGGAAPRG